MYYFDQCIIGCCSVCGGNLSPADMSQSCYYQCLAYHLHALSYGVDGDLTLGVDGYRMVTGWL